MFGKKRKKRQPVLSFGSVHKLTVTVGIGVAAMGMTGCYDRQELEQQAFVSVLGVDAAPGNLIDCTFRIAQPMNPSGGGDKGGQEPLAGKEAVTVRAHSINEAMLLAGGSIERTVTFSHLSLVLFSSELSKRGLMSYVEPMTRYREFRRTVPFAVTQEPAKDVISKFQPMLDTSTTRIADGISLVSDRTGLVPQCRLHDLLSAVESVHEDAIAPLYGLNQYVASDASSLPGEPKVSYQAGDVQRIGGNPVDWMGGAVFHGDKVVDTISGEESIYLRILEGGVYHATLNMEDPKVKGQNVSVQLHKERSAHYDITLSNPMKIRISVPMDVDVINVSSGVDYSEDSQRRLLERSLNSQVNEKMGVLLNRLLVKDQSDVIPISRYIRGKFDTYQQFASFPWMQRLKTADIQIQSDVHVRRFGVQLEPLSKQA